MHLLQIFAAHWRQAVACLLLRSNQTEGQVVDRPCGNGPHVSDQVGKFFAELPR